MWMSPEIERNSDLLLEQFTILCLSFHHGIISLIRFKTSLIIVAMIELET